MAPQVSFGAGVTPPCNPNMPGPAAHGKAAVGLLKTGRSGQVVLGRPGERSTTEWNTAALRYLVTEPYFSRLDLEEDAVEVQLKDLGKSQPGPRKFGGPLM